jgi:hypothetical protein
VGACAIGRTGKDILILAQMWVRRTAAERREPTSPVPPERLSRYPYASWRLGDFAGERFAFRRVPVRPPFRPISKHNVTQSRQGPLSVPSWPAIFNGMRETCNMLQNVGLEMRILNDEFSDP